jgi:hypothetical protein
VKLAVWNANHGAVVVRAAVLVPLAMALWWLLLKGASLWALRVLAWLPLGLLIAPAGLDPIRLDPSTGEWLCNVEVNTVARNRQTGRSQAVSSVEIAIRDSDVAAYASGWFSYIALALSTAPFSRKQARRVLWGLGIQTGLTMLALTLYVYLLAYGTLINSPGSQDSRIWWVKYFDHINSLVVPFAGPFLVAMLVHPEWREYVRMPEEMKTPSLQDPRKLRRH